MVTLHIYQIFEVVKKCPFFKRNISGYLKLDFSSRYSTHTLANLKSLLKGILEASQKTFESL
jgi:hypothetical protein